MFIDCVLVDFTLSLHVWAQKGMKKEKWEYRAFGDKGAVGSCDPWMSLQLFLLGGVGTPAPG